MDNHHALLWGPEVTDVMRAARLLIDQLTAERDALRAEVAQLDAICAHMRSTALAEYDEEFGFYVGGPGCEHPSLTGDRCDACGWKQGQS